MHHPLKVPRALGGLWGPGGPGGGWGNPSSSERPGYPSSRAQGPGALGQPITHIQSKGFYGKLIRLTTGRKLLGTLEPAKRHVPLLAGHAAMQATWVLGLLSQPL